MVRQRESGNLAGLITVPNEQTSGGDTPEISPEEAARKRAEILEKLQRPPRAGDEKESGDTEPTVSTMILPGD